MRGDLPTSSSHLTRFAKHHGCSCSFPAFFNHGIKCVSQTGYVLEKEFCGPGYYKHPRRYYYTFQHVQLLQMSMMVPFISAAKCSPVCLLVQVNHNQLKGFQCLNQLLSFLTKMIFEQATFKIYIYSVIKRAYLTHFNKTAHSHSINN